MTNGAFRTYIRTLLGVMSWKVMLVLGLMVCVGLTEGVGLLLLVPMLQLVGLDVQQDTVGRLAAFMSFLFATLGVPPSLTAVLSVYVLIISLHALLHRWQTTTNLALVYVFVARLRQRLYQAIAYTTWIFFARSRSSNFTHALTTELDRVGLGTYHLLSLLANAIVASIYLLLALHLSAVMTGSVLVCGAGLSLLLKGKMQAARLTGEGLSEATRGLYAVAIEHLGGMKTAKSYGVEDRHIAIFSRLAEGVVRMRIAALRNQAEVKLWFEIGSVVSLSLMLYGAIEVLAIPTAGILLLLFLFARTMPRLSSMQESYQHYVSMLPAFTSVMEMQALCEAAGEPRAERTESFELRRGIQLEQVSFSYEEGSQAPVICELNLLIRAGETTAIVGSSGAGKSTIADLVMGLVVPDQGRVLVDGTPLRAEQMRAWREHIGYVAQDTFLFHDSVRSNLLWARPDSSEEDLSHALRLAAAAGFVAELPHGLETVLGDRGVRLSGGERQRLALARAVLRRPSLLILDEATSTLDSENEKRIQSAIENLHGQITILVITHRLSTIRGADAIHVLEQGRLVESGDWDRLFAKEQGRFHALCRAQGIESQRKEKIIGGF